MLGAVSASTSTRTKAVNLRWPDPRHRGVDLGLHRTSNVSTYRLVFLEHSMQSRRARAVPRLAPAGFPNHVTDIRDSVRIMFDRGRRAPAVTTAPSTTTNLRLNLHDNLLLVFLLGKGSRNATSSVESEPDRRDDWISDSASHNTSTSSLNLVYAGSHRSSRGAGLESAIANRAAREVTSSIDQAV
jgi:hypothetical protein